MLALHILAAEGRQPTMLRDTQLTELFLPDSALSAFDGLLSGQVSFRSCESHKVTLALV